MSTLVKQENTQLAQNWNAEQVELVKNTVAKNATDTELQMFIHLAKQYNLDPFAKEIWFIKYKQGDSPSIFTSRDGYLKIAHQSGVFDGMESFTIDDEKGNPVKAVCKVFRKDMNRPFQAEIKVSEYRQNSPTWSKYPSAMAIKVAEVFALKRAFSINGLVTKEEIPVAEIVEEQSEFINEAQRRRLKAIAFGTKEQPRPNPWTNEQVKDYLAGLGIKSSTEIPIDQYETICKVLEGSLIQEVADNG